jgi:hypothetical protein
MRVPNAAPGEGPKKTRDHFPHWSIGGGERHLAYIAGPTKWVIGHPSDKGSKPCLLWMTKQTLPCRFCALDKEPCVLGYVPVYRATDWKPLCVIVREDERQWLDDIKLHTRVQIAREREQGAGLFIRPVLDQEPRFASTVDYRRFPQEMDDSCLVLWKMPELVSYLRCGAPSDTPVSLSLDATAEEPKKEDPPEEKTATEPPVGVNRLKASGAVDDAVQRLLRHAAQTDAEQNRKH